MTELTEVKPSTSVLLKLPWYTAAMSVVFVSMFYGVPEGSSAFDALALAVPGGARRAWTWYTYALLHGSTLHLWINMFSWGIYGALSEYENPPAWRTAAVSSASMVSGALAAGWQYRVLPHPRMPFVLLGASGGIYGLLACQVGNLVMSWSDAGLLYRMFAISALVSTTVTDVVLYCAVPDAQTSYSAHLGGAFAGLALGFLLPPRTSQQQQQQQLGKRVARWVALAALAAYAVMGVVNLVLI